MGLLAVIVAGCVILYALVKMCEKSGMNRKDEYYEIPSRYNDAENFLSDEADRRK